MLVSAGWEVEAEEGVFLEWEGGGLRTECLLGGTYLRMGSGGEQRENFLRCRSQNVVSASVTLISHLAMESRTGLGASEGRV